MKLETRLYRTWKTKSATHKALFISLIFHLFFFITTFYFVARNQPIASEKANLTAELISVENTARPKTPLKKVSPRLRAFEHEFIKPDVSTGELPPSLATPVTVDTETPRPALGRSLQARLRQKVHRHLWICREKTGMRSAPLPVHFRMLKGICRKRRLRAQQAIRPSGRNVLVHRVFSVPHKLRHLK